MKLGSIETLLEALSEAWIKTLTEALSDALMKEDV